MIEFVTVENMNRFPGNALVSQHRLREVAARWRREEAATLASCFNQSRRELGPLLGISDNGGASPQKASLAGTGSKTE
jgi:hypothetical protein